MHKIFVYLGNYKLPVTVDIRGDHLALSFKYFKPMLEEVKAMDLKSPGWDNTRKEWLIKNNKRNLFALDVLMNGPSIERYDREIENYLQILNPEMAAKLWMHQQDMFNFIMTRRRAILAAEMRTGKTFPTLKAVELSKHNECWWVAPKSALRGLHSELVKWNFRKKIELITYESFSNKVHMGSFHTVPGFLVFDEIQKLKNPQSQRGEAGRMISEMMADEHEGDEYVVGLSGTPSPKDPSDWWNLTEVCRPGWLKESSKNKLMKRLAEMETCEGNVGQQYQKLKAWKLDEVEYLHKRLKGLVLVKLKKDCLDLPNKMYEVRELPLSNKVKLVAKAIANNEVRVITAIQKLRQLSDGFQYEKEFDVKKVANVRTGTNFVGTPKLDELQSDIEEHNDIGRLVVYAGFTGSVDLIVNKFIENDWIVLRVDGRGWTVLSKDNEFLPSTDDCLKAMDRSSDDGKIERLGFVAQANSAGTGLELSASPTVIYYSNCDSGDARMQSEDRPYSDNMDKSRGLTIIDYCYLPTDIKMLERLREKKDLQSLTMGDLKGAFDE